jgi:5-methylcytosine-specific restriction endonuclease McrA|tara:strand:- start:1960 stop:2421 length:462 start_codon:yes stop_codon:yes gene_type:complete
MEHFGGDPYNTQKVRHSFLDPSNEGNDKLYVINEEILVLIDQYMPNLAEAIKFENQEFFSDHTKTRKTITRNIPAQLRYKILKAQKWRCNLCNTKLKLNKSNPWEADVAHIDHIHPYSKRESYPKGFQFINERENLQGLCRNCNLNKGNKDIN